MNKRQVRFSLVAAAWGSCFLALLSGPRSVQAHSIEECLADLGKIAERWTAEQSSATTKPFTADLSLHLVCLSHDGHPMGVVTAKVVGGRAEPPVIEPNAFVAFIGAGQIEELARGEGVEAAIRSMVKEGNINYRPLERSRRRDILGDLMPIAITVIVAFFFAEALAIVLLIRHVKTRHAPGAAADV